jgi:monofunctional biosynthetic peptidoglycan transglycosylase
MGGATADRSLVEQPSGAQDPLGVDAMVAAAIDRIVRQIPSIVVPAGSEDARGQPSAPGGDSLVSVEPDPGGPVVAPGKTATADSAIQIRGELEIAVAPQSSASPLAYVPKNDDRIRAEPPAGVDRRIDPVFERPAETPDHWAGSVDTGPQVATAVARTEGRFSAPWTWRRVARWAGFAVGAYFATVLFLILAYRFVNPPTTTLIAYQWLTGTTIEQQWVPIENISTNLLRAVVVSEDWGFCDHYGVDIEAIEKALEQAGEGKIARGASTISMQVIKNLFLSQSKSYLRKAVEIPLTVVAETVWPKSRMLEIYLNIAEWGPGVFGAEAAARHHFRKPASRLTEREAALLAAALPNPILRDAGDPSTRMARKASVIQSRMRAAGPSVADCAMTGRTRPARTDRGGSPLLGWQTTVKKRAGANGAL